MAKKIDPLNRKQYGAVTVMLTVTDIKAAAAFYQKALGFERRGPIMNGPDGKAMHAELRLRDTTLMLGPEHPQARSAKSLGATPVTLYVTTENVDKLAAKAVKLGARLAAPAMDQFWGDRTATIVDPEGNTWMVATHVAEPTPQEMKKKMAELAKAQAAASGS
jgi:PhnB protein